MNARSLRFQLVVWYASLLTAVAVLLGLLTFVALRHYLDSNLLEIQARRARQIADTLVADVGKTGEAALAQEINSLYAPVINDRFIRITQGDGRVVYVSEEPKDASFDPAKVPALGATNRKSQLFTKQPMPGGERMMIAAVRRENLGGGTYLVEVGETDARLETVLSQVRFLFLVGLPLMLVVAVAGGSILVRRALAPVEQLAHRAERITQHNLSERLPVPRTGDELEGLSLSLNRMISRLEDAIQNSKRFVADASHELRTPLTIMRGELEGLAQDTRLDGETRETLGSMLEEVERLARIVEGLLALTRLDAGEAQREWVPFDLAELVTSTTEQVSLLAEDKHLSITCRTPRAITVEGDRARMKQVVVNLLDNAIKYTPAGGKIQLGVEQQNGHAILEVSDSGVGIPTEAVGRVFDRFYRVDASRSRDQGGAGLGLSIVKSICAAHGAEVEVESVVGKGSRFRVKVPVVKQDFRE